MNKKNERPLEKHFHIIFSCSLKVLIFLSILILFECLTGSSTYAQIVGVKIGDRVRISAPTVKKGKIKGTVSSILTYQMMISVNDTTYNIPSSAIQKMELSTGKKRNLGKGLLIGAVSGWLILGITAAIQNDCDIPGNCFWVQSDSDAFIFGGFYGSLLGAATGAITGFFIKTNRWEEISLNLSADVVSASYENFGIEPVITVRLTF